MKHIFIAICVKFQNKNTETFQYTIDNSDHFLIILSFYITLLFNTYVNDTAMYAKDH